MAKIVIPSLPIYVLLSNIQTNKTQQAYKTVEQTQCLSPIFNPFCKWNIALALLKSQIEPVVRILFTKLKIIFRIKSVGIIILYRQSIYNYQTFIFHLQVTLVETHVQ